LNARTEPGDRKGATIKTLNEKIGSPANSADMDWRL
jgi:hypothetical protein